MSARWSVPTGRDAPLPEWLVARQPVERPRHDSVVIRGGGVGALVCAMRLARSESLAGRVRIAAPRLAETPRLINGCTLRSRTLDYITAASGLSPAAFADGLLGARRASAATHEQYFASVAEDPPGCFTRGPLFSWMAGSSARPLAYGIRNGHLVGRLTERAEALGVHFEEGLPASFEECRARADGQRSLVINASHAKLDGVPVPPAPRRFVVASQLTLGRRPDAALPAHASLTAMRRRSGAFDMGVFYPFYDPLTPQADFYGIFYRIVRATGVDKAAEVVKMRRTVEGVAEILGLEAVEAEATRGETAVPCLPWRDVSTHRPDYMDLFRTYSACAPIISGDGMTRAALSGWLAAESVLAGKDPVAATNRALGTWRQTNRGLAFAMTRISALLAPLLRHRPRPLLGLVEDPRDMWASIA